MPVLGKERFWKRLLVPVGCSEGRVGQINSDECEHESDAQTIRLQGENTVDDDF